MEIRPLEATDDLGAITEMLHRAYRPLTEAGMRFVASHQDEATTRRRRAGGETFVAVDGARVIGIITWKSGGSGECEFFARPHVAKFGQFAVEPDYQGRGVGGRLLARVEERAAEAGFTELALDTSELALDLITMYEALGYRFVQHVQWSEVNYRSVVMSKRLIRSREGA